MVDICRKEEGINVVQSFHAGGGSSGSHLCLRNLINMDPEVIFFLGDGGWDGENLIQEAKIAVKCKIPIHSIAFYIRGRNSGLPEIAKMTGGTYRDINKMSDYKI